MGALVNLLVLNLLVWAQVLLIAGCATTSGGNPGVESKPAGIFESQFDEACGRPIRYPVGDGCVTFMGAVGPLLKRRSDLIMDIWRTCPAENPCSRAAINEPACQGQSNNPSAPQLVTDNEECRNAQRANPSCVALLTDTQYLQQQRRPEEQDAECQQAKARLVTFDREIDRVQLQINWYKAVSAEGF